ncbi:MAG: hypothetical protein WDN26_16915 [Chitinophagaceae bacterium]
MKKYLLISLLLFAFKSDKLPEGWIEIEKTKVGGEKIEIYFFDYMSKLETIQPNYLQYKGREFTNFLQKVQFEFPAYVAKRDLKKEDSVIYFVLRPNIDKSDRPYFFDLEIVKVEKDFPINSLENKESYKYRILKTTDANGCRGSLVTEYNKIIQNNPNRAQLIGNGIQIADSIFTRVIPYEEFKKPFLKIIEANL